MIVASLHLDDFFIFAQLFPNTSVGFRYSTKQTAKMDVVNWYTLRQNRSRKFCMQNDYLLCHCLYPINIYFRKDTRSWWKSQHQNKWLYGNPKLYAIILSWELLCFGSFYIRKRFGQTFGLPKGRLSPKIEMQ